MSELIDKQYLMLSQFAYVKATLKQEKFKYYVDQGWTLKDIIGVEGEYNDDTILGSPDGKIIDNNGCMTTSDFVDVLTEIAGDKELGNLKLKAYQNDNNAGGMVAYAFEDNSGNTYFAFTGTEGYPAQGKTGCDFLSEDWLNNYRTGLNNASCQFEPSKAFVEKYKSKDGKKNYITGHSQGGANAMYACATVEGCTGCVFDGTGISQLLSYKERKRLKDSGLVNIVCENDIVGPTFFHSEKRIFAKQNAEYLSYSDLGLNHYTQAFQFENGKVIETPRTNMSKAIEKLTQRYYIYNTLMGSGTKDILNAYEGFNSKSDNVAIRIFNYSKSTMDVLSGAIKLPRDISVLILSTVDSVGEISVESVEEKYGLAAELAYTFVLATACPILFLDDYLESLKDNSIAILKKAVEEIKIVGAAIIKALFYIGEQAIQFGISLGNALYKFAIEAQEAWVKFETYITGIYNDIVNTGKAVVIAINDYTNKVEKAVKNFFIALSNKAKSYFTMFVNNVDKAVDRATKNINTIVNTTRTEIKKQYQNFKKGTNYLINYSKKTIANYGDKGINMLKKFGKKVIRGMGAYTSSQLSVDLIRLQDLQNKLRSMERNFGEKIQRILSEANKVTSDVGLRYNEYYVRQQIQSVNRSCDQIKERGRRVCEALQRKVNSLKYALEHYKEVENMLCKEIMA